MAQAKDARSRVITIASLLWDSNENSQRFSRNYDEEWVTRLYNGFARNLTLEWRFVLFTDKFRQLNPLIKQELLRCEKPDYGACIEPYRYGVPMILVGLDTVIVDNIDHLAAYCTEKDTLALPQDPYDKSRACNGVALIPEGQQYIYRNWRGENDMVWLRQQKHSYIDYLFPGQVVSYKGSVKKDGLGNAKIVYFHGDEKMNELTNVDWIRKNWIGE
jgi:hypothetical protein